MRLSLSRRLADKLEETRHKLRDSNYSQTLEESPNKSPMKKAHQFQRSIQRNEDAVTNVEIKKKPKFYGILGIDSIRDENEVNYKLLSPQQSNQSLTLERQYAFGLDHRLFTPEADRDKIQQKFNAFMKTMDLEIKMNDKYLKEKRMISLSTEPPEKKPDFRELEKVRRYRKHERYQEQLNNFNLNDNFESQLIIDKVNNLKLKTQVSNNVGSNIQNLMDKGLRQNLKLKYKGEKQTKRKDEQKEDYKEFKSNMQLAFNRMILKLNKKFQG